MSARSEKRGEAGINRRRFLKFVAGGSLAAVLGFPRSGFARAAGSYGKLVDTGRCIGCKRCMSACKRWNKLHVERDELVTDRETHLSGNNFVVVNLRVDAYNRHERTYVHWTCQHCEKPACEGVCPVSAIKKLPEGSVVINEKKCIGCRYCFQACPFKVPRFDFEKRVTRKCHLCYNRIPLLNYMKPACVAACPVGALYFNYKHEVVKEAKRRAHRRQGSTYIMGLKEAGGTDILTILPARPERMGLIAAPGKVINQGLQKIRITASGIMGASVIAAGMYLYADKTRDRDDPTDEYGQ